MISNYNEEIKLGDWIVWAPYRGVLKYGKVVHVGHKSLKVTEWSIYGKIFDYGTPSTVLTRNAIRAIPMSALKRYEEHVPS